MKILKNNFWTLLGVALVLMVAMTGDAAAASGAVKGNTVVGSAVTKAGNVFKSVRTIVFVIGGFGLVGLAVQAIFGKVKWAWFGALAVGLGVLAAAGALIEYATGSNVSQSNYQDTFNTTGTGTTDNINTW
ncbi:MAG: hypothetical protein J6X42_03885 [Alphaproteobacteria bacterium]|nr:hypothetical protein [Alphaproteobacteria bacterium]